jgi:hypothetical protein
LALSETAIRNAKPQKKPYKLSDGGGLFLLVQPGGGKWWRYKYRFFGKEKLLALGIYPDVSLSNAREAHLQARKILAAGIDPGNAKKQAKREAILKGQNTFEAIAREFIESRKHKWVTNYTVAMVARLERHVFPKLGNRPIAEITAQEFLAVVRVVEQSGALDMAMRLPMQNVMKFVPHTITPNICRNAGK